MKKQTFAKIAVLAAFCIGLGTFIYANSYKLPEPPKFPNIPEVELQQAPRFIDVAEYEKVRANLYDAALDLCIEASKGAYVWEEGVDAETKNIILTYRVPSLEVLLHAIETMDEFGGDLADSFDLENSPLGRYDRAYYEYNRLINGH